MMAKPDAFENRVAKLDGNIEDGEIGRETVALITDAGKNFNRRKLDHIISQHRPHNQPANAKSGDAGLRPEVTFGRGRIFRQHRRRPDRTTNQFAFAIGTNARKDAIRTGRAERTLKRANSGFSTLWMKIAIAAFAIRFELQHETPPDSSRHPPPAHA
jgi:hypothetical protein